MTTILEQFAGHYKTREVMKNPRKFLGYQGPEVLHFWHRLDTFTPEQWGVPKSHLGNNTFQNPYFVEHSRTAKHACIIALVCELGDKIKNRNAREFWDGAINNIDAAIKKSIYTVTEDETVTRAVVYATYEIMGEDFFWVQSKTPTFFVPLFFN